MKLAVFLDAVWANSMSLFISSLIIGPGAARGLVERVDVRPHALPPHEVRVGEEPADAWNFLIRPEME